MRVQARIVFIPENLEASADILRALELTPDRGTRGTITLFLDDERYARLHEKLDQIGVTPVEFREKWFDERELEDAEYLRMGPAGYWGYPQPDENMIDWQTESYDLTAACPKCGFGAIQNRPFLVKGQPRFGRNDILAMNWTYEFLVTEKLKGLIEQAGLTGADFWPLLQYPRKIPIKGYFQLYVNSILPPMSSRTEIVEEPLTEAGPKRCTCGKFGLGRAFDPVLKVTVPIVYGRESLKDAKDFNLTTEWFGLYDARPERIVSSRVFSLFQKHGIKRVTFEPIIVE